MGRRFARRSILAVGAPVAALLVAGCAASGNVEADSPIYDGLDPVVVEEVLANPSARGKIDTMPEDVRESMAQAIVRNFIQCRDALDLYNTWVTVGELPALPELPVPTEPIEPGNEAIVSDRQHIEDALASGEPDNLKGFLVGEGRCGEWIPADPENPNGPLIADEVLQVG